MLSMQSLVDLICFGLLFERSIIFIGDLEHIDSFVILKMSESVERSKEAVVNKIKKSNVEESESESDSSDVSSSDDSEESDSSDEKTKAPPKQSKPQSNLDLLLDLDDVVPNLPVLTPSYGGFLTPLTAMPVGVVGNSAIQLVGPNHIPLRGVEVLNKVTGRGLAVEARYTRQPHLYSPKLTSVELKFTNHTNTDTITDVKVSSKNLPAGMSMYEFAPVNTIPPHGSAIGTIGLDLNDSTQPAQFEISWSEGSANITLKVPIGELVRAISMPQQLFNEEQNKLKGMNEHQTTAKFKCEQNQIPKRIFEVANLGLMGNVEADVYRFCGQTLSSKSLVLVTVKLKHGDSTDAEITVNCEKLVVGSMLLSELKAALIA